MEQVEVSTSNEMLGVTELLRDCSNTGILLVSANGTILALNPEGGKIIKLSPAHWIGSKIEVLPLELRTVVSEVLASKMAIPNCPLKFEQDGSDLAVQIECTGWYQAGHEFNGAIFLLRDRTEMASVGLNMRHLNRLASIGTLSAGLAHEIKNALVAVSTFAETLIQRNRDHELAEMVGRELRRIDRIVSQMLQFAGPAKPTLSRISLHKVLEQSLRLIRPQLDAKQIALTCSLAAEPEALDGDDYHLEQAFLNILLNAIAALSPGGKLDVSTQLVPEPSPPGPPALGPSYRWVEVQIKDTGCGIAPEHLPRLFDNFFSTKPDGTGLGLAITRRIILEHRGTISVESEVQKGTSFRILLPLAS